MLSSALSKRSENKHFLSPNFSTSLLPRRFFARPTLEVAKSLIGQCLYVRARAGRFRLVLTECEAYCGIGDPASHAYRGPTPRSQVMFGPPGMAYVYFIYGMYHCLNVVTEPDGRSGAVLIRAGYDLDRAVWISGPGRLCKALGITLKHNRLDMVRNPDFGLKSLHPYPRFTINQGPRIGISKAANRLYRFFVTPENILKAFRDLQER